MPAVRLVGVQDHGPALAQKLPAFNDRRTPGGGKLDGRGCKIGVGRTGARCPSGQVVEPGKSDGEIFVLGLHAFQNGRAGMDGRLLDDGAAVEPGRSHAEWRQVGNQPQAAIGWLGLERSRPAQVQESGRRCLAQHGFDLEVTPIAGTQGGRLVGELSVVLCDTTTHLVCVPVRRSIELGFRVATTRTEAASVIIPLPEAKP